MSNTQHTPRPWKIGTPPPNGEQTIGAYQGLMVAVATTGSGTPTEANARLIAAAPELLEALQGVFNACLLANEDEAIPFELDGDLLDAASAAIAKATGGEV